MQRHEEAQIALDCALHGLPEPDIPWRANLPANGFVLGADGRGYLSTGRSPNIEGMSISAWVCFIATGIAPKKERPAAVRMAADYLAANERMYQLNEFGSVIYSGWTVVVWASLVWALTRLGENKLADGFRALLVQWYALARAALAECPKEGLHVNVRYTGRGGKEEVLNESRQAGLMVVVLCGERSWGHGHGLNYGHHYIARVGLGIEGPRAIPLKPGRVDGWLERATRKLASILAACAAPAVACYERGDWAGIAGLLRFPASQPCELRCYSDGSRVFIEGGDEPEPIDEDDNSNTPRLALMAIYRTPPMILSLPAWPAPNSGDTRIRQTGAWSDIDRDVHGIGWTLLHSHVGVDRVGDRWVSRAPDPAAQLVARFTCYGGDGWVLTGPREAVQRPALPENVEVPTLAPRRPRHRSWWRRLLGID